MTWLSATVRMMRGVLPLATIGEGIGFEVALPGACRPERVFLKPLFDPDGATLRA